MHIPHPYIITMLFIIPFLIGTKYELENPSADLTLADYLRNTLHLTGTKIACGSSGCGSCTVILSRNGNEDKVRGHS